MPPTAPLRLDPATLRTQHVVQLGGALRARAAALQPRTIRGVAEAATSLLYDALRDERGAHALALVRLYLTRAYGELTDAQRQFAAELASDAALDDGVTCLALVSSRGVQPAWNDPARSRGHRAIPLPSVAAVERSPMIARLLQQLGLEVAPLIHGDVDILMSASERRFNAFHVPQASGSPYIPAQEGFVNRFGIESAIGFGGALPDGSVFTVVGFSAVPLSAQVARASELLALYLRLALIDTVDLRPAEPLVAARSRAAALAELVEVQERGLLAWASTMAEERDAQRRRYVDMLAAREQQVSEQNVKLERTQRAMLSVIEDLRDARTELEQRVAARTHELGARNEALVRANRELEEFAYIASHDLQEPLRTIAGYLQLLQKRYGAQLDGDANDFVEYAVTSTHRLQALIESLLAYSRITTLSREPAPVALAEVVAEVEQSLAVAIEESQAEIHVAGLPVVQGDRMQLLQLFQNLMSNSLKFRGDAPARIWIDAHPEGSFWRIEVRDEGIGFDPKFSDSVFRVFRRLQRTHPGTGIGLSICKKIVERHGGTIRAHATPGQGARFEFTLPRLTEPE